MRSWPTSFLRQRSLAMRAIVVPPQARQNPRIGRCSTGWDRDGGAGMPRGKRADGEGTIWKEGNLYVGRVLVDGRRIKVKGKTKELVAAKLRTVHDQIKE